MALSGPELAGAFESALEAGRADPRLHQTQDVAGQSRRIHSRRREESSVVGLEAILPPSSSVQLLQYPFGLRPLIVSEDAFRF